MIPMNTEFQLEPHLIYLNHAAVAPWPQRTAQAVARFAHENLTQGAANYPLWLQKEAQLREQLRDLLNAPSSDDIALLKNTSEALSVVAYGLTWRAGDTIVSTQQEFPSNRIVWESLQTQGVTLRCADVNVDEPEAALLAQVDENTRLIAVSAVQYANGLRLDLEKIGAFCRQHDILFCVDAIQQLGALAFDVQAIQADFVMADGHKWMLGAEGLAVFYCAAQQRERLQLKQFGWHMVEDYLNFDRQDWQVAQGARRFECGSPNMLGIHALSASLSLLLDIGMSSVEQQLRAKVSYLLEQLSQANRVEILSPRQASRSSGIVTFRLQDTDNAALFKHLQQAQVVCAQRGGGIRFSPHFYTSLNDLDSAVAQVFTLL